MDIGSAILGPVVSQKITVETCSETNVLISWHPGNKERKVKDPRMPFEATPIET